MSMSGAVSQAGGIGAGGRAADEHELAREANARNSMWSGRALRCAVADDWATSAEPALRWRIARTGPGASCGSDAR